MDVKGRLPSLVLSDTTRITSVLGFVGVMMTLSAAGVLSGVGLFILMMIQMNALMVVYSSILLTTSLSIFLACYLWLSA